MYINPSLLLSNSKSRCLHLKHNAVILSVSHAALMSLCAAEVSRYVNMQNETL